MSFLENTPAAPMTVPCHYCDTPIDPRDSFNYRRITGWERKAQSGSRRGGSDVVLREHQDVWACGHCVARLRRGVAPSQEALI